MITKKITPENCVELSNEITKLGINGDINSQASSWQIVFLFCVQNGMETKETGIEDVINFIKDKL